MSDFDSILDGLERELRRMAIIFVGCGLVLGSAVGAAIVWAL